MDNFFFDKFFNIDKFKYKDLFEKDIPVWNALLHLSKYLEKVSNWSKLSTISKDVYLENPEKIFIGKDTKIESGAYIKGPCIIGDNCQVRHGAYIRGNVITGDNCVIGHATEIKNSILLNNASAAHFAYVGDSILGNNVNLGAGVKCANFRLDKNEISFFYDDKKIKTGLLKLGAIIGDNVQIGCNSVLNPASFLERDCICYPCINISGVIKAKSIVKADASLLVRNRGLRN
jgi:UDP-N-acetylglucosamine diphosphorylase / glucose-1-phosphate thymidylyltransferase / UDP-N-acetylgalactosamine diphosphorylase / glucosamine-1-phosphate N-acetyltransferase / galactosamine-1-phosphate N-acetyltransferase